MERYELDEELSALAVRIQELMEQHVPRAQAVSPWLLLQTVLLALILWRVW